MRKMWRGNLLRPVIQRFFTGSRKWPHTFSHVSSSCTSHGESLSGCATSLRPKSNGWLECSAVWCIFMNNTLQAAVHLGRNCLENSRFTENQLLQSVKQLFQLIEKLIKDQKEINSLTTIDFKDPTWRSTTLLCDKAFEITNAKTFVFADSVLSLGSISEKPFEAWTNRSVWFLENAMSKIWIESTRSRWNSSGQCFHDSLHWAFSKRFTNFMTALQGWTRAAQKIGSSSCPCSMTLYGENSVRQILDKVAKYSRRFPLGRYFLGPGSEKKWCGIDSDKPKRNWDKIANANYFNVADYAPKFPQRRWSFLGPGCE